jgi:N-acetylmuramoyl-L-alanine amidase
MSEISQEVKNEVLYEFFRIAEGYVEREKIEKGYGISEEALRYIRWILSDTYNIYIGKKMKKFKVALVVGHPKNKGAFNKNLNVSEWSYNNEIADLIIASNDTDINFVKEIRSIPLRQFTKYLNSKDYDLILSLHLNSSTNKIANRTEVYHYCNSQKGKELATILLDTVSKELDMPKGKLNAYEPVCNYPILRFTKPVTVLLEPFFMSNNEVMEDMLKDRSRLLYANSIIESVDEFINGKKYMSLEQA